MLSWCENDFKRKTKKGAVCEVGETRSALRKRRPAKSS